MQTQGAVARTFLGGWRMILPGWLIVGFLLSILWALGAGIYTRGSDVQAAEHFASYAYKVCTDGKMVDHNPDLSSCEQERAKNLNIWMQGSNGSVAFVALAPIPFGWLAAFILFQIARVQVVGFRTVVPWVAFTWPKKALVILCGAAFASTVVFGIVAVMNLYVDTKVPVGLSPFPPSVEAANGGDLVVVEGTWTRSGSLGQGSAIGDPLQTSKIECYRQERRCTEARAYVIGDSNTLAVDALDYEVQSWTPAAIVLQNDLLCASEVFTIDLNTKSVTGAGRPTNNDSDYCKIYGTKEKSWRYQLTNGFDVYWVRRQSARPILLRVIQAFFGN